MKIPDFSRLVDTMVVPRRIRAAIGTCPPLRHAEETGGAFYPSPTELRKPLKMMAYAYNLRASSRNFGLLFL